MKLIEATSHSGLIEPAIDLLQSAGDATDLCRRAVHDDITGEDAQGAHILLLDNSSNLRVLASYGVPLPFDEQEISIWDDNPLAQCIREKQALFVKASDEPNAPMIYCNPWIKASAPVACWVLVMKPTTKEMPYSKSDNVAFSKLGAMFLDTLAINQRSFTGQSHRPSNPDQLTARQKLILGLMAEGNVNAEIARELMLSESTIRQETVRIYRALGVGNRHEASARGRALGLISTRITAPPPRLEKLFPNLVK